MHMRGPKPKGRERKGSNLVWKKIKIIRYVTKGGGRASAMLDDYLAVFLILSVPALRNKGVGMGSRAKLGKSARH